MTAKRLLVIDDEQDFAEFLCNAAEEFGYEAEVTTKADAFKKAYERFDPTVIILDMVMPDVDGIELTNWLVEQGCAAKIIVISGYNANYCSAAKVIGEGKGMKSISTLGKPVSLKRLETALCG